MLVYFQVWSSEVWLDIILYHLLYRYNFWELRKPPGWPSTIQILLVFMYNHHAKKSSPCLCHLPWTFFQLLSMTTFIGAAFCFGAFCFKSMYLFLAFFAIGEFLVFATQVFSLMQNRFVIVWLCHWDWAMLLFYCHWLGSKIKCIACRSSNIWSACNLLLILNLSWVLKHVVPKLNPKQTYVFVSNLM